MDDISNKIITVFGMKNGFVLLPWKLPFTTALPGAHLLNNGKVFVCGGGQGDLTGGGATRKTAILDPDTYTWTRGPDMHYDRGGHVSIKLKDGRILVCGGVDTKKNVLDSCEIYDPATGKWTLTGRMNEKRVAHRGVLLPSGKVLVCGGTAEASDAYKALMKASKTAEIYDPRTGKWTKTSSMGKVRIAHTLTVTGSKVVAAAGFSVKKVWFVPVPYFTDSAEYFYNGKWYSARNLIGPRAAHSAIRMPNGRILVCGGVYSTNILDPNSYMAINTACVYNPSSNSWYKVSNMRAKRGLPTLFIRPDNKVVVSGGGGGSYAKPVPLATCEVFNGSSFALNTHKMALGRTGHMIIKLPEGNYIVIAGGGGSNNKSLDTCELYFP